MNKRVYTVGQVNQYIRNLFAGDGFLGGILVSGEVSNCKYHSSGHIYFSLKDAKSAIACVMFAGMRKGLSFRMKDGDRVIVSGSIDVYERDGRYQLYASAIRLEGMGILYEKFLVLKKELEEEGLFDPLYKKRIPSHALRIGVATAPAGAAVRDIQNISARRNPYVQLILCPTLVQGEGAVDSIVRSLQILDSSDVDIIIVGRGGGSFEDLQAFNEEKVARAIFACRTPVISAVGHETDYTIADYVSDMRAPTPSAAAELAVFDYRSFQESLSGYRNRMSTCFRRKLEQTALKNSVFEARLRSISPTARLRDERMREAEIRERLTEIMQEKINSAGERAGRIEEQMTLDMNNVIRNCRIKEQLFIERMKGRNPLDRLKQGFSYAEDSSGAALTSVKQVDRGDRIRVYVTDGSIYAEVTERDERMQ